MKMVIGGACQGKKRYAQRLYPGISWCDGAACTEEELLSGQGVYGFEKFIERWLTENREKEPKELAAKIITQNPDLVVVTAEIGCGLVPEGSAQSLQPAQTGWTGSCAGSERGSNKGGQR